MPPGLGPGTKGLSKPHDTLPPKGVTMKSRAAFWLAALMLTILTTSLTTTPVQAQAVVVPVDGPTVAVIGQVEPTGYAYPAIVEVSDFAGLLAFDVVQVDPDGFFVAFADIDAMSDPEGDADLHVWAPTATGYEMMGAMIVAPAPGESTDDPPPAESETVGKERERKVAEITGGDVDNTNITTPTGSTDIDVSKPGSPPIYITVGGPGKSGQSLDAWKTHLQKMKDLMDGKAKYKDGPKKGQPVPPGQIEVYLEQGTPQDAIDAAVNKFGQDHVHIFTR